jgi:subtilisin family serine protease
VGEKGMNKKIIGILICTLLIITALQTLGTMSNYVIPNDPYFNEQWHLDNNGQTGGTPDCDIDAPEAWEIETGDPNVVIAIIDTGVDYTHPDLIDNLWVNEDEIPDNGIDDDENGYIDDYHGYNFFGNNNDVHDFHGHGTLVSGIAGASTDNNIGVAGVAWNCKLMIVKVCDQLFVSTVDIVLEGLHYAINNGAKILSVSLGVYEQHITANELQQLSEAADYAYNKGCIAVAAAGNDATDNPLIPAGLEKVIAVGGTDSNDSRMEYSTTYASNYGEWVDVAAPGYLIYTTAPIYSHTYGEKHYSMRIGTSFATPQVSGLAALLLSRDSTLSPDEVKTLICENVDPYDSEYYIGTGRINAYKALSALNTPPDKPIIDGSISGKVEEEQEFIFSATDQHNDDLSYIIDWGDESEEETIGPFPSGEEQTVTHIWYNEGDYTVRVKARDIIGAESEWSTLEISIPKTKLINIPFFLQRLFHRFPLFEKILNQLV